MQWAQGRLAWRERRVQLAWQARQVSRETIGRCREWIPLPPAGARRFVAAGGILCPQA